MPYARRRRRRVKRKPRIYGTKAQFMPKTLALKRYGQVSTKTFYFKASGTINSNNVGVVSQQWLTQFPPLNVGNPNRMPNVADSYTFAECYNEYQILAVKVKIFAANIGTEPGMADAPLPAVPGFNRGATVMYLDQEVRENEPLQQNIVNVMNLGSAKMIPSRSDQHTKLLYRKKGIPDWGTCDRNVPIADRVPDPWFAGIYLLGNYARVAVRPLWFYTVTYKVIFRGRSFTP